MSMVDPENPLVIQRRAIHAAISDSLDEETSFEGHILSGWVLILETVGPNGERGMVTRSSDASGDLELPPWTSEGWARYVAASGYFDGIGDVEVDE